MDARPVFLTIAAVAALGLVLYAFVPSWRERARRRLTPLAAVAFACVVAGIVFGEARWLGYSLIGTGVALAVLDAVRRARRG